MLYGAHNDNHKAIHCAATQTVAAHAEPKKTKQKILKDLAAAIQDQQGTSFLESFERDVPTSKQANSQDNIPLHHGAVHEAWVKSPKDHAATTAFLLSKLRECDAPFLWVTSLLSIHEYGVPYGPGLAHMGIDPARLLLVTCRCQQDALWTLEEGLKAKDLAAVVGEIGFIDLKASRRLVLAAREHATRAVLLLRSEMQPSTAAYSRWQVTPTQSAVSFFDQQAPGAAQLKANLIKHRGGRRPIQQNVECPHATDHLPMVSFVGNRSAAVSAKKQQAAG